jgi:hypothetical protein
MEGFLQGSLLQLAVCAPQRRSLLSHTSTQRDTAWRTFIVSAPATWPTTEQPATEEPTAVPALTTR